MALAVSPTMGYMDISTFVAPPLRRGL